MKKAVFPGSFDPITLGHVEIIERALPLFDQIILAIGVNADKKYMFAIDQRVEFLRKTFSEEPKIIVQTYEGLTVNFCRDQEAGFLLRGLRNSTDFEFEKFIAQTNQKLSGIETVFLISSPERSYLSSTVVRDVIRNGGEFSFMVPEAVKIK